MAETVAFSMMAMVGAVTYNSLSASWSYVAHWSAGIATPDMLIAERRAEVNEGIDRVWKAGLK